MVSLPSPSQLACIMISHSLYIFTDDSLVEGDHDFTIYIVSTNLPSGIALLDITQQTAVILDNDSKCIMKEWEKTL